MPEPDSTESARAPVFASAPAQPTRPARRFALPRARSWRGAGAAVALAVAVAVAVFTIPRVTGLQSEAARRLQSVDERLAAIESLLARTQDELRDARNRTAVLESRAQDTAGLQAQIEKLFRNLAEDTTDVLLAELEASLVLAGQQLALGGSAQAVLTALQERDERLARENDPALQPLRRALLHDIERLKAYPAADVGSLALRIDGLSRSIDRLPLLASLRDRRVAGASGETPRRADAVAPSESARKRADAGASAARPADPASGANRAVDAASAGLGALRDEIGQLFRVRRVDSPDAMLLAPEQAYFARENLRLLLLNVRLSLLSRNESLFRSDVERAVDWLRSYYDAEDRGVANAIAQLRQLAGARLMLEPPSLAESLAAVRAARVAREAAR